MKKTRLPRWLKISCLVVVGLMVGILALLIGLGWYVKQQMLDSGGVLFTGHSESLTGIGHKFKYVQPTIYAKP